MSDFLPAPIQQYKTHKDELSPTKTSESSPQRKLPSYSVRLRQKPSFRPRDGSDFGDGGAYPEYHHTQFPLNMGRKGGSGGSSSNTLALSVHGETGSLQYDAIVKQHHRDKKNVYTKYTDLVEKDIGEEHIIPSVEDEQETTNRTRDALQALVSGKIASSLPSGNIQRQKSAKDTSSYIRYTPHDQGQMGEKATQRIIRMVEAPVDPMEPPKFQHKKAVRGPPSPPVPVLHSPPRKLTLQDQQNWKIPPCISNWKNSKGFTIALDKRLAADGRGLQQVTVNDNFASLSEALAIAERKARDEVNMRGMVQKKQAMLQKEEKEKELRELAAKARMERAGIDASESRRSKRDDRNRGRSPVSESDSGRERGSRSRSRGRREYTNRDRESERERERDRIRRERKKERERELRMAKIGKKGKLMRDEDRDISEKIALGQLQGTGNRENQLSGEAQFDSRLFNQSQGLSSGFTADDEYNIYSKPLTDRGKASVYRPSASAIESSDGGKMYEELKHTKRFRADKEFRGTAEHGHKRDGPVQFSYDDQEEENEESPRGRANNHKKRESSRSISRERVRERRKRSRSIESGRKDRYERRSSKRRSKSPEYKRRHTRHESESDSDDPFGLDQFLSEAKNGRNHQR